MRRIEGGYELRDVGSTNGIKLDGVRYEVIPLRSGVTVHIGDVAFDFSLSDEENEALAREKPPGLPPITQRAGNRRRRRNQSAPTYAPRKSGGSPVAATLMFLILAALAFFTGLAVRYHKDTGGSLIEAIQLKAATPAKVPQPSLPGVPSR